MKRTFPIIVILITLSLLGLILLQTSWLKNLLELTRAQMDNKIEEAGSSVALDIYKGVYSGQVIRLPRRGSSLFSSDFHLHVLKPPTVDEKYTPSDIYAKLKSAFEERGLKKLKFEFAVSNTNDDYEMYTDDYVKAYWDTSNNKRKIFPIVSENLSESEAMPAFEKLMVIVPDLKKQVWESLQWVILSAVVFMLVIIAAFYVTIRSLLNQKKLSEIKSDFINNMTHEFKTPLATISLAVDALRNEKVKNDPEKAQYFNGIIKEENVRMNKHVETILQAALMEKQELKLNVSELHVHDIIRDVMDTYQLQLQEKSAHIELMLNAKNDLVSADDVHFAHLLSNLIDNAIKYSKENLLIRIITHSSNNYVVIRVEDNGIGMSKESVKRIFEKFYRAHTGNLHNVKGFGLGMSYVKTVVDAHKGKIKVDSTLGRGSSFTIEMPLIGKTEVKS